MINLIEGQLNIGGQNILAASGDKLNTLAEDGAIERRKDAIGIYYYVEDEVGRMRFGVTIHMKAKKIQWLRLHWLDSPMKGWDDVSVEGVKNEFRMLLQLVKKIVGRSPDIIKNSERTWCFQWGQIDVSFDLRSFQTDIFMVPRLL